MAINNWLGTSAMAFGLLLLTGNAMAQADHVITPTDIAMLRQVDDPQISPDGRQVVYGLRTPDDPAKLGPTRLWTVKAAGGVGRLLRGSEEGDRDARWSPGGRSMAFVAIRHDTATGKKKTSLPQLWLASPYDAPAHLLSHVPGAVASFRWSPDGSKIAAIVNAEPSPLKSGVVEVDRHQPEAKVYVIDVSNGTAQPVTTPDKFVFDLDWAPDGQQLVIRYGAGPGLEYFWYLSRVSIIDLQGRELTLLPHNTTAVHPSFSPDARRVVYGYFNDDGITGTVVAYTLDDGRAVRLGGDWNGSLRDLQWNADGKHLTGLGFEDVSPLFVSVDAMTGKVVPGGRIKGDPYTFSRANNGTLAFVASTRQQPDEIWVKDEDKLRALTDTNPAVRNWRLGKLQEVQWRSSRDATIVHGLLMLPGDARPGKPVKALVQIHGGPYDAWADGWLGSWHNWAQVLAGQGYAVLMPNPRGSDGRGDAFAKGNVGDWGGGDYQDVIDGVDAMEKQGIFDPQHVAIGGWSYGGEMSAWAAGHSSRFKTAIVGAGVTDIASMTLTSDVGRSFITPYFGDPIHDREKYLAHSPLTYVHDVRMPVLILHGEQDARVPIFQSEMFYNALKAQGTPVEMVRYRGAPHWFGGSVGPAYEKDVQQRVLDWLDRYLSPPEKQGSTPQ